MAPPWQYTGELRSVSQLCWAPDPGSLCNLCSLLQHQFSFCRRGTALANLQTVMERQVMAAKFGVSGAVSISNPDPTASLVIEQLQLECQWGLSAVLPCSSSSSTQQQLGTGLAQDSSSSSKAPGLQEPRQALLIHPGDTARCSIHWLTVPAKWGTNFRQSCRVVARTASGGAAQSSHFLMDFAAPHVLTVKQECVIARTQCEITGSTLYQTPGVGQQLEQGVLVCDNKTLSTKVIVNDVYGLEGGIPDDCRGNTKVSGCWQQASLWESYLAATALWQGCQGCWV